MSLEKFAGARNTEVYFDPNDVVLIGPQYVQASLGNPRVRDVHLRTSNRGAVIVTEILDTPENIAKLAEAEESGP